MVFGWSEDRMLEYDEQFQDLLHYLFVLEPPAWPFATASADAVARGEGLFATRCASCHGSYGGESAGFPDLVVPLAQIDTDPVRTQAFAGDEIALFNESWFAEPAPFEETDGYLAPPLIGVWASAPYFHNGSVPDLASVLDSAARPARWRLVDPPSYDPVRGGWAWEEAGEGDLQG
jgi:cytochrome c peroxidase